MALDSTEQSLTKGIMSRQTALESRLSALVEIASDSKNAEGVNRVGQLMEREFLEAGLRTSVLVTGQSGQHLVARTRHGEGNRLLLMGHMDTVHVKGSALTEDPQDSRRLLGPGAADMKGGLCVLAGAVRSLAEAGLLEKRALTVLLTADEELGSPTARSLIEAEGRDHHLCLVVECGTTVSEGRSAFVTERSGMRRLIINVQGVASHSGAARGAGVSAAHEMAHLICALEELNDPDNLVSINVGLAQAGEAVNTVPSNARIEVDCRFPTVAAGQALAEQVDAICSSPSLQGTSIEIEEGVSHIPLVPDAAMDRMAARIIDWGGDLGLSLESERRGGCSDGNVTAAVGCPTIDGLGVVGGCMHSPEEWIWRGSLAERAALLALTIHRFHAL